MIIIDEAAHINPDLFFKVILPILQMKNTALFALSSPEGSQNYFSKLINLKVDGHPFFRVCDCQLICEDCRKLDRDKQILCNHVKQTAHWLSSKKGARLKMLYAADPATAIKEFGGIIEDEYVPCFPKELIAHMFTGIPAVITTATPTYVFVTVDPSGGGMSQLAICSGYYRETDHVVSGSRQSSASEITTPHSPPPNVGWGGVVMRFFFLSSSSSQVASQSAQLAQSAKSTNQGFAPNGRLGRLGRLGWRPGGFFLYLFL